MKIRGIKGGLIFGFAIAMALMAVLLIMDMYSMESMHERLTHIVDNHNVKTRLITTMRNAARERTLSLYKMLMLDNAFDRDEEYMRFNSFSLYFIQARRTLLNMDLNASERAALKAQGNLTKEAVALQERVVEHALNNELEVARKLLHEKTIPAQARVLETLEQIMNMQKSANQTASNLATQEFNHAINRTLWFGIMAITIGIVIAVIIVRRATQTEKRLYQEKEKALVTLHSIGDGVITTDASGKIESMNKVASELIGWSIDSVKGRLLQEVFKIRDDSEQKYLSHPVNRVLIDERIVESNTPVTLIKESGESLDIEHTIAPIFDYDNSVIGTVVIFRNVTEIHNMAMQMAHQASHDPLTGLINRREFESRLQQAVLDARTKYEHHVLCYIDLDQFKVVNDTCGHTAGDELLRQLAAFIGRRVRETDSFGRLGGDEFGLLLTNCNLQKAIKIVESIRSLINEFRFTWENNSFEIGASIGVVAIQNESGNLTDIMRAADSACFAAKDLGRNRIHIYQPDDYIVIQRRGEMRWLPRIHAALENNQFQLSYQKIIPINNEPGKIIVELLIRLIDSDGSLIPPMAFMPAAERYDLMPSLDKWMIKQSFVLINSYYSKPHNDDYLWTINLSSQSLCDEGFLQYIVSQYNSLNLDPHKVCFEITETAALANLSNAANIMSNLHDLGFSFALDNFGSGISSFHYLKNLPFNYLKIDGCLIKDMIDDDVDSAMVDSINTISHKLGFKTVAECVEHESVLQSLKSLGVDYAQGFRIHKPQRVDDLVSPDVNTGTA